MRKIASRKRIVYLISLLTLLILYLFPDSWLPFFGRFLVVNDNLEKSDAVIVLGTDLKGAREAWGVEIYKMGLAQKIILCGYQAGWNGSTAEFMKRHVLSLGVPEDAIIVDYGWEPGGTWRNAMNSLKLIQENKFKSAIIVSSNFHTTRSRCVFKKIFRNAGLQLLFSACPDSSFNPDKWWTSLKSIKIVLSEYTKLIYYLLVPPEFAVRLER